MKVLHFLPPALFGALFGGAVGYVMRGQLLPAEPIWLAPAIVAFVGAVALPIHIALREARAAQRGSAMRSVTEQRGGQFAVHDDGGLRSDLARDFSLTGATCFNVLRMEIPGGRLAVFDLTIVTQSDTANNETSTSWKEQTAAYFAADVRFPVFTLQPQDLGPKLVERLTGLSGIDFPSHPDFSRQYFLTGVHGEHVRRLFSGPVLDLLVRQPGLRVEAAGQSLLLYRPETHVPPEEIERFIADMAEICRLFRHSARSLRDAIKAGLVHKSDPRAGAERMPGMVGKLIRQRLVTRDDVEAFVRQPAPRRVPANIRHYGENSAPLVALVIGAGLLFVGGPWAFSFARNGDWGMALILLLLALIGAVVLFYFGRARLRLEQLLRRGQLTEGRIESFEPDRGMWRATVRFATVTGSAQASCEVPGNGPDERARKLYEAKKPAALLYDPVNPRRCLLVDVLVNVSTEYDE